jgi:DNA-binding NtrC family response regulator
MINDGTVGLVMTAYGTVESAVEAMKAGAYDYVLKPFDLDEIEMKVERAIEHRRLLAASRPTIGARSSRASRTSWARALR